MIVSPSVNILNDFHVFMRVFDPLIIHFPSVASLKRDLFSFPC